MKKMWMLCLGLKKSLLSPRLKPTAQGMAQSSELSLIPLSYSNAPRYDEIVNTDDTYIIWEKDHCIAGLQLNWIGFD